MHLLSRIDPTEKVPTADAGLELLVRRHQVGVWRYLRALGCPADLADDLTQDVFVVVLGGGFQERSTAATRQFLLRTARHLWLRRGRDGKRRAERLAEAAELLWERDCGRDDGEGWLEALRECVAELGDRARAAVRLFYGERKSRADVARELGMKETGVKTLLQRVRKTLKECVQRRTS